jgi:two-component system cell cycle sensor histidine kinase/response regulator CckA
MKLDRDVPLYHDLHEIQRASERAAELTRQLLAFSRRQITEPRIINLNDVLLDMDKMLRRLISEDIELITQPAENLGSVKVDPAQVEQVIANLAVNARDAMPEGGKLTLDTSPVHIEQALVSQNFVVESGDYVVLSVRDDGIGMADEVKEHIFEPFFTTKRDGKGTGLGLATCYGIVKQNGGYIWVDSEPEQGTTFRIYFPRVDEEPETLPERVESRQPGRGKETILLVEDEPSVREIAARVLREYGYRVLEASTGEEALRVARSPDSGRIHLLLSDIVMPELGGRELAERLVAEVPGIKVVFISGYPGDAIARRGHLSPARTIIQKPFTPAELARRVRNCLDTASADRPAASR